MPARWIVLSVVGVAFLLPLAGCRAALLPDRTATPPALPPPTAALPPLPTGPTDAPPVATPPPVPVDDRHADVELESRLPRAVASTPLFTHSLTADEFITPATEEAFAGFLSELGRSATDVTLAAAIDPTGAIVGSINALRVAGADPGELLPALLGMEDRLANGSLVVERAVVGAREVTIATIEGAASPPRYFHATQDIVFVVGGADETTSALFLETLP